MNETESERDRLARENAALRQLLWLRHDLSHFAGLYGDDGEMLCAACGIDFKRTHVANIQAAWERAGLITLKLGEEK